MKASIPDILTQRLRQAVEKICGAAPVPAGLFVIRCNDEKFGDYQFNGALPLAKATQRKPRELAEEIVKALEVSDICAATDIAGPGFINFRLAPAFLAAQLAQVPAAPREGEMDRLGLSLAQAPERVVVDMSSPNLAKEMHVGHLRSSVIGESVARILEFAGDAVERVNHVGDWGTQFGMLVSHLRSVRPDVLDDPEHLALDDLEVFYVAAKKHFDDDPAFAEEARRTVVALQGGDAATQRIWRAFCQESLRHCHAVYDMLGIDKLVDRGESFYNDRLAPVVEELSAKGMVTRSEGADCIFLDGFTARDGTPLPMMVRKSDGGYLYASTDLAAAQHRLRDEAATRLIYVVGAPQKQHFEMLFAVLRKAGWAGPNVRLEHLAFGSMLGPDGKPFKTREGGTIKLKNLLEEAVARARKVVEEHAAREGEARAFTPADMDRIAQVVGIGAVKYFDLSHNLTTDYRFDWETMLSLEGNTAPYMLYAYARIRSIGRKAGVDMATLPVGAPLILEHDAEIALAKALVRFAETVQVLVRELRPSLVTDYLFDLTRAFSRFYDRKLGVRVVDAETAEQRISRLRLCDLTARVIRTGLYLLGIPTLEQM